MAKWVLSDPVASTTYTFPVNPEAMNTLSPNHQRGASINGWGKFFISQADRQNSPFEWSFSGKISTQTHYDAMVTWLRKPYPVNLTIHDGRQFKVLLKEFKPVDKRSAKNPTRWTYQFDALVIERLA